MSASANQYPITIRFTAAEMEALMDRIGRSLIPEVLAETYTAMQFPDLVGTSVVSPEWDTTQKHFFDIFEDLELEIVDRCGTYSKRGNTIQVNCELEEEIWVDALEGSTYWVDFRDYETPAVQGAMTRLYNSIKKKMETAFNRKIVDVADFYLR